MIAGFFSVVLGVVLILLPIVNVVRAFGLRAFGSSIWIAVFLVGAALWTWRPSAATPRPPLQGAIVATIIVGFAGVVMLLRPNFNPSQAFAGMLGLMSGMAAAFAYMQVVALSRVGEPETRTVFYFATGSAIAGGLATLVTGHSPWPAGIRCG